MSKRGSSERPETTPLAEPTAWLGPVAPAAPRGRVMHGDLDMRIDRDGVWYYHGSPVARKELVCLFASVLRRDTDGGYWLVTPAEIGRVEVEDAPFLAVELFSAGTGCDQTLSFRTNIDEIVAVDQDHHIRVNTDPDTGEPSPYVLVRPGIEARITRSVFYELVARGMEEKVREEHIYGVWSSGVFFPLGTLNMEPEP